jgi:nucleotide-binding universal stress UspA family protein
VDAALSSYFRFANLAALRELAQLWLDDSVLDPVAAFKAARGVSAPVQASVIVVGLEGSPADEWLIRYAARLAGLSDARLQGVHVRDIDNLGRPPTARLEEDRRLLGEVHGTLAEVRADDAASGLLRAARQAGACQLVIGASRRSRWSRLLTGSTVDQVLRAAGDMPVQVVNVGRPDKTSGERRTSRVPLLRGGSAPSQPQQHPGAQHDQRCLHDQGHRADPVTPVANVAGVTWHAYRARGDVRQERSGAEQHAGRPAEPGPSEPGRAGQDQGQGGQYAAHLDKPVTPADPVR